LNSFHLICIFSGMKILLCNDDGIHARGIKVLHEALRETGDIQVVAPDVERSAAGHAITLSDPIKTIPVEKDDRPFGLAVGGTPADCIKLALCLLMKDDPPDLVISGINLGSNTGITALYSGTVSAATEAVILGVQGIAISLCTYQNPQWDTAARVASEITEKVLQNPLPDGTLLNVNIPNLPYDQLRGMKAARMGRSRFVEKFLRYSDPRGNDYYWLDGELDLLDDSADTDVRVVQSGYVAITPIHIDLTAYDAMEQVKEWNIEF